MLQPLVGDRETRVVSIVLIVRNVQRKRRKRTASDVRVELRSVDDVCAARRVLLNVGELEKGHMTPYVETSGRGGAEEAIAGVVFGVNLPRRAVGLEQIGKIANVDRHRVVVGDSVRASSEERNVVRLRGMREAVIVRQQSALARELAEEWLIARGDIFILENDHDDVLWLWNVGRTGRRAMPRGLKIDGHDRGSHEKNRDAEAEHVRRVCHSHSMRVHLAFMCEG